MHCRRPFLAGVLLALAAVAGAEEPPALTLDEARALALGRNWDLLAARADLDLAEAQRLVARALPNPDLSLTFNKLTATGLPEGATPSGSARDSILALTQVIEIGGKRSSRIDSARAGVAAARGRFEAARLRLDAAVVKAYAAALAAREGVRVNRLSAGSLARSAEIATFRFEAGEISRADKEQVEIAAGRFQAETRNAEAAAVQSLVGLEVIVGAARPQGRTVLADDLDRLATFADSLAARPEEDEAIRAQARPDVQAASATLEQAQADLRLQRAVRIPDPTFLVQYENDQTLPRASSLGLGLSLPVPLFNRNRGGIVAAEVTRDAARRALEQARARAFSEIVSARAVFEAARQRRALVHDSLLPKAERVEGTVAFAYEKGGASLLELLEAERNLNDLRLAALSTQADALAAAADLAAARGEALP